MTDYELLSIFIEFINTTWMIFATYVSIVFAFLIAGYLVARKLTPGIISLVVTLYTLVAVWSIFALNRNVVSISATAAELNRAVQEGDSSLGWLPAIESAELMTVLVPALVTGLGIVAYLGSIFFFFYQRNSDPPAES